MEEKEEEKERMGREEVKEYENQEKRRKILNQNKMFFSLIWDLTKFCNIVAPHQALFPIHFLKYHRSRESCNDFDVVRDLNDDDDDDDEDTDDEEEEEDNDDKCGNKDFVMKLP